MTRAPIGSASGDAPGSDRRPGEDSDDRPAVAEGDRIAVSVEVVAFDGETHDWSDSDTATVAATVTTAGRSRIVARLDDGRAVTIPVGDPVRRAVRLGDGTLIGRREAVEVVR